MRKSAFLILLIIVSLFSPLMSVLPGRISHAQTKASKSRGNKLAESLRERVRQSAADSGETARVIVNVSDGADPQPLRQTLSRGPNSPNHLEALGLMVAEVPLSKLEEASERDDVSWISADQEVRSLDSSVPNPADNTSHVEVTTGASKILPKDTTSQLGSGVAYGGAGNGIGIAILDSGITPCDNAEFVGYQWKQSSGTLGTGLFSQSYLATYDRIKKHIDFPGENRTDDVYGHGTHTAGIAAGTGQSSEDDAKDNPSLPTFGGVATGANLIRVRGPNFHGMGTVSNEIARLK